MLIFAPSIRKQESQCLTVDVDTAIASEDLDLDLEGQLHTYLDFFLYLGSSRKSKPRHYHDHMIARVIDVRT